MALTVQDVVDILREMNLPGVYPDFLEADQSLLTQGIDSLDALTIFTQVEEKYGIRIPDEDFEKLDSIDDIVAYVNQHFGERVA
jgi:acyl carrier protein